MKKTVRISALLAAVGLACSLIIVPASTAIAASSPSVAGTLVGMVESKLMETLSALGSEIKLSATQKEQFDYCMQQMGALRATALGAADVLQKTIDTELAKPQPDLALIASTSDAMQAQMIASRQAVRADWLRLYSTLSPAQQSVVGMHLQKQWQRFETVVGVLSNFAASKR